MTPQILTVVIEYHVKQNRIILRGVFDSDKVPSIPLLSPENTQNRVKVFQGVTKGIEGGCFKFLDDVKG